MIEAWGGSPGVPSYGVKLVEVSGLWTEAMRMQYELWLAAKSVGFTREHVASDQTWALTRRPGRRIESWPRRYRWFTACERNHIEIISKSIDDIAVYFLSLLQDTTLKGEKQMLIRRTAVAAALVAVPLALAAPAQATCSYFGPNPDKNVCGMPNIQQSVGNAKGQLRENFNVGKAVGNLQHALTHGVGEKDKNAP